jgi:hypothetical protein
MSDTSFRLIMFGAKHGHGGRSYVRETACPTLDSSRLEARAFLAETNAGVVDLRVETRDESGSLKASKLQGAYYWDHARRCAVLRGGGR